MADRVLARHGARGVIKALLFLIVGLGFPGLLAWIVTPKELHWAWGVGIFALACLIVLPFIFRSLLTLKSAITDGGRAVWIEGDALIFTGTSQIAPTRLKRGEIESAVYFEEHGYDNQYDRPTVRITARGGKVWIIDLWEMVKTVDSLTEAIEAFRTGG